MRSCCPPNDSTIRVLALTCKSPHLCCHIFIFSYTIFSNYIWSVSLQFLTSVAQHCHNNVSLYYTALSRQCVTLLHCTVTTMCHSTTLHCHDNVSLYYTALSQQCVTLLHCTVTTTCHSTTLHCHNNVSLYYTALSQQYVTLPQALGQRESSERALRLEIDTLRATVLAQSVGLGSSATDAASIAQVMKSLEGGLELFWIHVPLGLTYQALQHSSIYFFLFFLIPQSSVTSCCPVFAFLLAPTPRGDYIKSATRRDRQSEVWRMIIYFLSFSPLISSFLISSHLLLSPPFSYPPMFVLMALHKTMLFFLQCRS